MGAGQSKVSARDQAILEMKLQRDKLKQYQRRVQHVIDKETALAAQCIAQGNKRRALLALRQKRYQQSLLERTDDQLMTLENLTRNIEFALVEKDVVYGLMQGNAALKSIQKEISLEHVEKLMDDTADAIAYQESVSEMLSTMMTNADEEEVQAEYERLGEKELALPDAPQKVLDTKTPVEEVEEPSESQPVQNKVKAKPMAA